MGCALMKTVRTEAGPDAFAQILPNRTAATKLTQQLSQMRMPPNHLRACRLEREEHEASVEVRNFRKVSAVYARFFVAAQNDFAARLKRSVTPRYADANHDPVIRVKGPLNISAKVGSLVLLYRVRPRIPMEIPSASNGGSITTPAHIPETSPFRLLTL